jgi:hypothetical protein
MPDDQPARLRAVAAHGKRLLGVEQRCSPVELRRQLLAAAAGVRGPCRAEVVAARAQDVRWRLRGPGPSTRLRARPARRPPASRFVRRDLERVLAVTVVEGLGQPHALFGVGRADSRGVEHTLAEAHIDPLGGEGKQPLRAGALRLRQLPVYLFSPVRCLDRASARTHAAGWSEDGGQDGLAACF